MHVIIIIQVCYHSDGRSAFFHVKALAWRTIYEEKTDFTFIDRESAIIGDRRICRLC